METKKKNIKQKAIENWVMKYSDQLFSWAFHKTFSKETAEDLVQETFLSAVRFYENCKNKDQAKTWLFSILNNKITDHYRKKAKTTQDPKLAQERMAIQMLDSLYDQNENWTTYGNELFENTDEGMWGSSEFNDLLTKCLEDLIV